MLMVKFNHFIGIDVSRDTLDIAVSKGKEHMFHKKIENDPAAIKTFLKELRSMTGFKTAKAVFCMENTGFYNNHIKAVLIKAKARFVSENALHIRNSLGILRGKNDKIDAKRIADYAYKNREHLKLWLPKRPVIDRLSALTTLRNRLIKLQKANATPLKEQSTFISPALQKEASELSHRTSDALKEDLRNIDERIDLVIKQDRRLSHLFSLITSVPSVGPVTAVQILASTNEFLNIETARQLASYCGIAPFSNESGTIIKKAKVSQMANKRLKSLLHVCAIGAILCDKSLKAYYERKTKEEGKNKMLVLNAIRNKIVARIFACIRYDRPFEKQELTSQSPSNSA